MKLVGIKINNYKSFGKNDNFLFVDDLNAIVGKNESGKSNIIDAIAEINCIGYTPGEYFKKNNRDSNGKINIELEFAPYKNETLLYPFNENIKVIISDDETYNISENFGSFVVNHKNYSKYFNRIKELQDDGLPINKPENIKKIKTLINMFEECSNKVFVAPSFYKDLLNVFRNTNNEKLIELSDNIEALENTLDNFYCCFPFFVKINNDMLKSKYNLQELNKEIENESILFQFLNIAKINMEELKGILQTDNTTIIRNFENKANDLIKKEMADKFNKFYTQEIVKIIIAIQNKELNIIIKTSGALLNYDERSNGLKWYLNLYIQLIFKEGSNKVPTNNIILMDEPGVYLHTIAQKELLNLFESLVKNFNQILYTTHSPFMLDFNNIQNIRAIEKDKNGYSHIYNKVIEIPTTSKTKRDTITPIISALGYNISYNIGPSFTNKNIITEGITDYLYIQGYLYSKKSENNFNIIPCTGADNVPAIASVLFGWGCEFNILLDQDKKGHSIYDSISDSNQLYKDRIIFVDGEKRKKEIKLEIEDLFSADDKKRFGLNEADYKDHKYNYAYDILLKVKSGQTIYSKKTLENFKNLLNKIL